jgi:hypothetical protein
MEASWEPPPLMEVEDGGWVYQGRTEYYVNCHVQVALDNTRQSLEPNNHVVGLKLGGQYNVVFAGLPLSRTTSIREVF